MFTLTVEGKETSFESEADAFEAASREFYAHGSALEVSLKMQGRTYIGQAQMRHWWSMRKAGKYYPNIPY